MLHQSLLLVFYVKQLLAYPWGSFQITYITQVPKIFAPNYRRPFKPEVHRGAIEA